MTEKEKYMTSRRDLIDRDGDVADLSRLDMADMKPSTALPQSLQVKLKGRP